ncbi:MAG: peptide chain release factor N(5)-glutamine methyltransferase [Deltaproteobacteria bacterium]|nr:MAG: peptide chain release factor N(5)-glutamine methyltransferase [Deltaproteobacteria bacterium]TMB27797.1 MAG: peptide chain release factor N(5)-glutamine methyltransferase [Deltaproteobacteria bacterium]
MAEAWTVRSLLQWARDWLAKKGMENPRLDAELLLAHALRCDRVRLYIDADKPLAAEELARFKSLIKRRGALEPVAYILGTKEFYGRPFAVAAGIFIPRPETELLVRMVTEHFARDAEARVLDLCAGSGAVGISIAAERPRMRVDLVELSAHAAAVARANAEKHALGRVRVVTGDLYAALPEKVRYDAIAANPPYVPTAEIGRLAPDVIQHEPHIALFAGEDGLAVIRRIVAGVGEWLAPGGLFVTEIDPSQGEAVAHLLRDVGLMQVRVERDLAGLDRHVAGRGA